MTACAISPLGMIDRDGQSDGRSDNTASPTDPTRPHIRAAEDPGDDAAATVTPRQIIEALLFASDVPIPAAKLAAVLGVGDARDVRRHIAELNQVYESGGHSFRIQEIAGGFQVSTLTEFRPWLAKLLRARQENRLSPAALETLAITAYKQPVTRAEIESIRGVAVGDVLNRLREMNLVKIAGRADDLGRPLLYGTTKHFLEVFGLASLEDLPKVDFLTNGLRGAGNTGGIATPEPRAEAVADAEEPTNPAGDEPASTEADETE